MKETHLEAVILSQKIVQFYIDFKKKYDYELEKPHTEDGMKWAIVAFLTNLEYEGYFASGYLDNLVIGPIIQPDHYFNMNRIRITSDALRNHLFLTEFVLNGFIEVPHLRPNIGER